jgi:poly(3-hydroxybutyrate) depolymerase
MPASKGLTTADVPPQFLQAAFLVGHVPQRALRSDPRVSYALYVPPSHYNPRPPQSSATDNADRPAPGKLPLLVAIHGTSRKFAELYHDLIPFADSTPCALLVPLFPAGLDGPLDLDSYKLLRSATLRADTALLSMLDEVGHTWPGIDVDRVFLMGFSGGGQFAHRFLYLHPERLAAVSVGAPGRVTLLDDAQTWPAGVADVSALFGRQIDKERIRQIPIHLVIGGEDNQVHGGEEFWKWVRQMKAQRLGKGGNEAGEKSQTELVEMDRGRLDSLRDLQKRWQQDGIETKLDVVEGVMHSSSKTREPVLRFLRPLIQGRH